MKQIIKSQFVTDVTETKMTRKELATKYELPETEIKKIMKAFGLKISRKQHATYTIVDDTIVNEAVEMTPFTEAFSQNIESESHVN
jgi:Ca2+-binding EF-hand superfamily protein